MTSCLLFFIGAAFLLICGSAFDCYFQTLDDISITTLAPGETVAINRCTLQSLSIDTSQTTVEVIDSVVNGSTYIRLSDGNVTLRSTVFLSTLVIAGTYTQRGMKLQIGNVTASSSISVSGVFTDVLFHFFDLKAVSTVVLGGVASRSLFNFTHCDVETAADEALRLAMLWQNSTLLLDDSVFTGKHYGLQDWRRETAQSIYDGRWLSVWTIQSFIMGSKLVIRNTKLSGEIAALDNTRTYPGNLATNRYPTVNMFMDSSIQFEGTCTIEDAIQWQLNSGASLLGTIQVSNFTLLGISTVATVDLTSFFLFDAKFVELKRLDIGNTSSSRYFAQHFNAEDVKMDRFVQVGQHFSSLDGTIAAGKEVTLIDCVFDKMDLSLSSEAGNVTVRNISSNTSSKLSVVARHAHFADSTFSFPVTFSATIFETLVVSDISCPIGNFVISPAILRENSTAHIERVHVNGTFSIGMQADTGSQLFIDSFSSVSGMVISGIFTGAYFQLDRGSVITDFESAVTLQAEFHSTQFVVDSCVFVGQSYGIRDRRRESERYIYDGHGISLWTVRSFAGGNEFTLRNSVLGGAVAALDNVAPLPTRLPSRYQVIETFLTSKLLFDKTILRKGGVRWQVNAGSAIEGTLFSPELRIVSSIESVYKIVIPLVDIDVSGLYCYGLKEMFARFVDFGSVNASQFFSSNTEFQEVKIDNFVHAGRFFDSFAAENFVARHELMFTHCTFGKCIVSTSSAANATLVNITGINTTLQIDLATTRLVLLHSRFTSPVVLKGTFGERATLANLTCFASFQLVQTSLASALFHLVHSFFGSTLTLGFTTYAGSFLTVFDVQSNGGITVYGVITSSNLLFSNINVQTDSADAALRTATHFDGSNWYIVNSTFVGAVFGVQDARYQTGYSDYDTVWHTKWTILSFTRNSNFTFDTVVIGGGFRAIDNSFPLPRNGQYDKYIRIDVFVASLIRLRNVTALAPICWEYLETATVLLCPGSNQPQMQIVLKGDGSTFEEEVDENANQIAANVTFWGNFVNMSNRTASCESGCPAPPEIVIPNVSTFPFPFPKINSGTLTVQSGTPSITFEGLRSTTTSRDTTSSLAMNTTASILSFTVSFTEDYFTLKSRKTFPESSTMEGRDPTDSEKARMTGLSEELEQVVITSGIVVAVGSSVFSPTTITQTSRLLAFGAMFNCLEDEEDEPRPPYVALPIQFAIGDTKLKFYRGAVIGTTLIGIVLPLLIHQLLWRRARTSEVERFDDKTNDESHKALRVCGVIVVVASAYLAPNVCGASMFLLTGSSVKIEALTGLLGVALCVGLLTAAFVAIYISKLHVSETFRESGMLEVSDKGKMLFCAAIGCSFDGGKVFHRTTIRIYAVEDVAAACALGLVTGISTSTKGGCIAVSGGALFISLCHLAYLLCVRPYARRLDTVFMTGVAIVGVLLCSCSLLQLLEVASVATQVFHLLSLALICSFFVQCVLQCAWCCIHRHLRKSKRQTNLEEERSESLLKIATISDEECSEQSDSEESSKDDDDSSSSSPTTTTTSSTTTSSTTTSEIHNPLRSLNGVLSTSASSTTEEDSCGT